MSNGRQRRGRVEDDDSLLALVAGVPLTRSARIGARPGRVGISPSFRRKGEPGIGNRCYGPEVSYLTAPGFRLVPE